MIDENKKAIKSLIEFGLSENEAKLYQSALNLGETSPFALSRDTGIPRTTVYTILTALALKGLIELESSTDLMKQGTKVRAKNPSVLREILWGKRAELYKQELGILDILPYLKGEYLKDQASENFQFFDGMKGANYVMFDYNNVNCDTYVFDYQIPMDAIGRGEMNKHIDKNISAWGKGRATEYNLIPLNRWSRHVLSYQIERNPHYLDQVEYRHLPFELSDMSIMCRIKEDRLWIVSVKGKEVWGLKIHSQNLADSLVSIHQALWKLAVPITLGMVKSWGKNEFLEVERSLGR
ncbi:MAG: helix-turn-helix domain-containing protein [bacterium]